MTKTRTYRIWQGMKRRCTLPSQENYERYGGRGITYDPSWESFLSFLSDMGECPSDLHTIERRETDGNYAKDNCVWATVQSQAANRRSSILLQSEDGRVQTLKAWAKELGINYKTALGRHHAGRPITGQEET
jgi:hypothetical protein